MLFNVRRFFAFCAASLGMAACGSASPTEAGGDARFDASPSIDEDAASAACGSSTEDAGSGTAFSDLYRDYFGPTGAASCAGNGQCHGDSSQAGSMASSYVCGSTATGCYQGMISGGLINPSDKTTPPQDTLLWSTIRKCSGGGTMPLDPPYTYTFDGASLEESNVNISAEFSDLIIAQRAFEANSKAVTTFDTVAQETINMVHA